MTRAQLANLMSEHHDLRRLVEEWHYWYALSVSHDFDSEQDEIKEGLDTASHELSLFVSKLLIRTEIDVDAAGGQG